MDEVVIVNHPSCDICDADSATQHKHKHVPVNDVLKHPCKCARYYHETCLEREKGNLFPDGRCPDCDVPLVYEPRYGHIVKMWDDAMDFFFWALAFALSTDLFLLVGLFIGIEWDERGNPTKETSVWCFVFVIMSFMTPIFSAPVVFFNHEWNDRTNYWVPIVGRGVANLFFHTIFPHLGNTIYSLYVLCLTVGLCFVGLVKLYEYLQTETHIRDYTESV